MSGPTPGIDETSGPTPAPPPCRSRVVAWRRGDKGLEPTEIAAGGQLPADALWLDLVQISREMELAVEQTFQLEVPTRDETRAIEASSRMYREDGTVYLTATLLVDTESGLTGTTDVTFIVCRERIITVRYDELWTFRVFAQRASRARDFTSAELVFAGLMEATIERLGERLERVGADLDRCADEVFRSRQHERIEVDLQEMLYAIGRAGMTLGSLRESLIDKSRVLGFAEQACRDRWSSVVCERLKTLLHDAASLSDHVAFDVAKMGYLNDATLGMISIEQNRVIKIFSIMAVVFMPPTMVASVYGMNFHTMPELSWRFGYLLAIGLMIVSAIMPLYVFKRRGWL